MSEPKGYHQHTEPAVWMVIKRSIINEGPKEFIILDVLQVCSNKNQAILFINRALIDNNSGIENDTLLDIRIELIDGYFSHKETIDTKLAPEWLTNE